jgi:hypothetical protein
MPFQKPSSSEEKYFNRQEAEKIKMLALEKAKKIKKQEREILKKTHWMHCPKCGMELHQILFRGVIVDKCFHCDGVFLTQKELEKLAGRDETTMSHFLKGLASLFHT